MVRGTRCATTDSLATENTSPVMAGSTVQGARKRPTAVSHRLSIKFLGGYICDAQSLFYTHNIIKHFHSVEEQSFG